MEERKTWYLCDPDRNPECKKRGCGWMCRGECYLTSRRTCARIGENGAPLTKDSTKGTMTIEQSKLGQTIAEMNRIREIGIVNAQRDLRTIDDAIGWLQLLSYMMIK